MYLTSYEPWNLLDQLSGLHPTVTRQTADTNTRQFSPAVDVEEQENSYLLQADLPGVDVKDIEITLEKGVLKISGERRADNSVAEQGFRRIERAYGKFERHFSLPDTADDENIEARTVNGVLTVTIAKKETSQPRRIEVQH